MSAWDMLSPDKAASIHTKDKQRCGERLAGDRCLLKQGHDGNHAVVDPTKETK
jgi:hypothetical protein